EGGSRGLDEPQRFRAGFGVHVENGQQADVTPIDPISYLVKALTHVFKKAALLKEQIASRYQP
ncbi:hypothetical protein, partial [Methylobacterium soli]|uniref:hypothetical protein n=1 Tax=Methylobacterium soli TaxID=553447 RepID=UPI001EE1D728